mmetsp:Transcript_30999/g.73913  ORF Transcript_30999/g.73913 Transcript_30999/m.73913 type:complete len:315 (-) Transcript_30999:607-1551(-)
MYGESNVVRSPAFPPGTGKTRHDRGLFHLPARAATSSIKLDRRSTDTSPGTGTVSIPTPHTDDMHRSCWIERPSPASPPELASSASLLSSRTGSMSPEYPVLAMPGTDWIARVTAAAAARLPVPPKAPRTSSRASSAAATDPPSSRLGFQLVSMPKNLTVTSPSSPRGLQPRHTSWIGASSSPSLEWSVPRTLTTDPASPRSALMNAPFSSPTATPTTPPGRPAGALPPGKNGTDSTRDAAQKRKFPSPPDRCAAPSIVETSRMQAAAARADSTSSASTFAEQQNLPEAATMAGQTRRVSSGSCDGPNEKNWMP